MGEILKAVGTAGKVYRAAKTVDAVNDVTTNMDLAMRRDDGSVDYSLESVGKAVKSIETTVNRRMDDKVEKYRKIIEEVKVKGEALLAKEAADKALHSPNYIGAYA